MSNSTVSGPFRSENGFQELVGGVWVPVGGGGGGTVITVNTSNFPGSYQLPSSAVVGDVITIKFVNPTNAAAGTFTVSAQDGSLIMSDQTQIAAAFIYTPSNPGGALAGIGLFGTCTFTRINPELYSGASYVNWAVWNQMICGFPNT